MKSMHALSISAVLLGLAGSASAAEPYISELFWNPAGTDQGWERVELAGDPGASLDGYWFVVMEGENVPAGTIDQLVDLTGYTFGSNGLLLIADDATNVLDPAPDAATNVVIFDFSPDIENGANTFILVKGTPTFALGQDLDQGPGGASDIGDGVLDAGTFGGVTVVDAVGWIDSTSSAIDYDYANDPQIAIPGGALGKLLDTAGNAYDANCFFRVRTSDCSGPAGWAGGFLTGATPPGPFAWDTAAGRIFGFDTAGLDPLVVIPGLGVLNACSAGGTVCYPDCDLSGTLNIDDFICFQTFFAIGDTYADCDLSGNLNIDDFICFQTFFALGC
jgi:hypothetical protein